MIHPTPIEQPWLNLHSWKLLAIPLPMPVFFKQFMKCNIVFNAIRIFQSSSRNSIFYLLAFHSIFFSNLFKSKVMVGKNFVVPTFSVILRLFHISMVTYWTGAEIFTSFLTCNTTLSTRGLIKPHPQMSQLKLRLKNQYTKLTISNATIKHHLKKTRILRN